MEEIIYECFYDPSDLIPILEILEHILEETVKARVLQTWILGISIAIFGITIALLFGIFLSNYSR